MQKFLDEGRFRFFESVFYGRRLVFMAGPEGPGEGPDKPKPQGVPEGVNLDNANSPENAKYAEQFKKDFADKIKDNKMTLTYVQDSVTYQYSFEVKPGVVTIRIQKLNVDEQKEKGETNPISTEITFARLYSGKVFGMPELPKVLDANRTKPAPTPAEVADKISKAKDTAAFKESNKNVPKNMLTDPAFQKGWSDYYETGAGKTPAAKTELGQWLAGTKYAGKTADFLKDLKEGKVASADFEKVFQNAGMPIAPEAVKEGDFTKEQAEKQMTEKVKALLAKYETMDPKAFMDSYKTYNDLLAAAGKEVDDYVKDFAKKVKPQLGAEVRVNGFYINTNGPTFSTTDAPKMTEMRATDWAYRVFLDKSEAMRSPDDYKECSALMARISDYVNGEGIAPIQAKIAKGEVSTLNLLKGEINAMFDTFVSKKLKATDYIPKGRDMNMWISVKGVPVQLTFGKDGSISWSYKGRERDLAWGFLHGTEDRNSALSKSMSFDDQSLAESAAKDAEVKRQTEAVADWAWKEGFKSISLSLNAFKKGDTLDFTALDATLLRTVEANLSRYQFDRNLLKGYGNRSQSFNFDFGGQRYYYHFNFDQSGKLVIDRAQEKLMNKDAAEAATKQKMTEFFKKYQDMPPKEFVAQFKSNADFYKQFDSEFTPFLNSFALAEKDQKVYVEQNGFHVEKRSGGYTLGYSGDDFYKQKKQAAEQTMST